MSSGAAQSDGGPERPQRVQLLRRPAAIAAAAALAVVLWGGYSRRWSWTGINGSTATLWDWLNLLLLPVAVAILPLWLSRRARLARQHKVLGLSLLFAFGVLVLAGYLIPWAWTGFQGNRLWDWLELLVLPLAVALSPLVLELRQSWRLHHLLVGVLASVAFAVVVIGGYVGNWGWTGFRGNTLWDWLHLWLLPLLIPVLVIPTLVPKAMSGVTLVDEEDRGPSQPARPAEDSPAPGPQDQPSEPPALPVES